MQLTKTISFDSVIFIEKKRIENRLWAKSDFVCKIKASCTPPADQSRPPPSHPSPPLSRGGVGCRGEVLARPISGGSTARDRSGLSR